MRGLWQGLAVIAGMAALFYVLERRGVPRTGRFLGIPYDMRPPTPERLRDTLWNPHDDRILMPHAWGWGYTINFGALLRRVHLV